MNRFANTIVTLQHKNVNLKIFFNGSWVWFCYRLRLKLAVHNCVYGDKKRIQKHPQKVAFKLAARAVTSLEFAHT